MEQRLPRCCTRVTIAFAFVLAMSIVGAAQRSEGSDSQDVDLNITEKHISEAPFERSLQADLSSAEVRLLVGVSAAASRVEITLRGVTGVAHFRASLDAVRQQIARPRPTQ